VSQVTPKQMPTSVWGALFGEISGAQLVQKRSQAAGDGAGNPCLLVKRTVGQNETVKKKSGGKSTAIGKSRGGENWESTLKRN